MSENILESKHDLYFTNIVGRWKQEIGASESDSKILIFSPFVTSSTANDVIRVTDPSRVRLYTVFKIENFVSGASSIETLKNLLDIGVGLFRLDKLHAKLVVIPSQFLSIGSQNLTNNGQRNLESTVISNDEKDVDNAIEKIQHWIDKATAIESEDIDNAIEKIEEFKAKFGEKQKEMEEEATRFDVWIRSEKDARARRVRELKAQVERQRREQIKRLIINAENALSANRMVVGNIREYKNAPLRLYIKNSDKLLLWNVPGYSKPIRLESLMRYLCIITDTATIAWVRVAQQWITFVECDHVGSYLKIPHMPHDIFFDFKCVANWEAQSSQDSNINIDFTNYRTTASYKLSCFFDLKGITYDELPPAEDSNCTVLRNWIEKNPNEFSSKVQKAIIKPFENRLEGMYADAFFKENQDYELRLALLEGYPILLAREV